MSDQQLFGGIYRISSARLPGHDYAEAGYYFVTICTKGRAHWFGEVQNQTMILSEIGKITNECWKQIPAHYPYVSADDFIIMPNHIHGIVMIGERAVETPYRASLQPQNKNPYHKLQWQSGGLGVIINRFKGACTKHIRDIGHDDFAWQPRFHDHIIRDENDTERIRRYIRENPNKWGHDELFG